jgi:subtilisin family serine protease
MKKVSVIIIFACLAINSFCQSTYTYFSNNVSVGLFVDSLSMFIKTDTLSYDTVSNKLKDFFTAPNDVIKNIIEDNAILIESTQFDTMSILDICTYANINVQNIEFWSYGFTDSINQRVWVRNEVNCKLDTLYNLSNIQSIINTYNGTIQEVDKWGMITISCDTIQDVFNMANSIYNSGYVEYSLPDFYCNFQLFTDPFYNLQYYLNNTGQTIDGTTGTVDIDIDAPEAWTITTGSTNLKIAVVDDGVEDHIDLRFPWGGGTTKVLDGYTPAYFLFPGNGEPKEYHKHGQACAGIIAAEHNDIGIRGVSPDVYIVPFNIFDSYVDPYSNECDILSNSKIAKAIKKAWDDFDVDIISCSWGLQDHTGVDQIEDAINDALNDGRDGKGCVVVAASGNEKPEFGNVLPFPASHSGVLSVGAIDKYGDICF